MKILIAIHLLLITGITLRILYRSDLTATSRLAWFIIVAVFPYIGVALYIFFGEVILGLNAKKHRQNIFNELRELDNSSLGDINHLDVIEPEYRPAFKYAASVNQFAATVGNSAQLMIDATEAKNSIIKDIDNAEKQVHVLYYIWLQDNTGTAIAEALIRAAKRDVKCRAMVDALGSRDLIESELWRDMESAGVELRVGLPIDNWLKTIIFGRIDLRNHRKITIIDGKITYCGSQNCADPEFRVKAKYAPWADIMLRLEGPIVNQNQLLFASDWLAENNDTPYENFILQGEYQQDGFLAQVFGDGPTERDYATPQLFSTLINQCRKELVVSTPYFVPDYTVLNALCAAAYRGVKVTMIFPKNNDSWIVAATSQSFYKKLLAAGIDIYEYIPGLLHAKTLTLDGRISFIGSTNMDLRSFDLNFENNILLYDPNITNQIYQRQQEYIQDSIQITHDDVNSWPFYKIIWNNIVATVGPVL